MGCTRAGERGKGRGGSVNRDIGRFLAKWRCINTGQGIEKLSKVVGIALTRENTVEKRTFPPILPVARETEIKKSQRFVKFSARGWRGMKRGLALNCGGKKKTSVESIDIRFEGHFPWESRLNFLSNEIFTVWYRVFFLSSLFFFLLATRRSHILYKIVI